MNKNKILIYGAAGYMGKLFTKYAKQHHFPIVLAARSSFETPLDLRIFDVNASETVQKNLEDVLLVVNLAGPFAHTNVPLVKSCIATQTHYIDIAGEVNEFKTIYVFHEAAAKAGIMVMPGAGFGVVPTDIAANLAHAKLPDATHLQIRYATFGEATRGTLKTVLKDIHKPGIKIKNGAIVKAMPASSVSNISKGNKKIHLVYNPWRADLFTASLSTGIPNIETFSNFPGFVVKMMQGKLLWIRDLLLKRFIGLLPEGPSEKQLKNGSTICQAEVTNEKGEKAIATIYGPEAYVFTAASLLVICQKIIDNDFKTGFQTPNIYGSELIQSIPGVRIE